MTSKVEDTKTPEHDINLSVCKTETGKTAEEAGRTPLFEDLLQDLGAFGHWQRVIFFLISLADVWGAWAMLLPILTGATPKWRCQERLNETDDVTDSPLSDHVTDWTANCTTGESSCDSFVFDDEFTSIVSEWSLVCGLSFVSDLITSIQMAGVILGTLFFGQLSDLLGRKPSYFMAHIVLCIGGVAASFAPTWQVYAFFRSVVGCGFGGVIVVNNVYVVEFVGKRWRTLCGTVGFWGIGGMTVPLLGYFIRDWRYLSIATSASGLLYLFTWLVVPESPRWLCQKGRFDEAEKILAKIAEKNGTRAPDLATLKVYNESEGRAEALAKKYNYWHLFVKKIYRTRTFILIAIWFTNFVIYYELSYNLRNLSGNRYLNLFLGGCVDTAGMIAVILITNRLGRRRSLVLFMGITCIANTALLIIWLTEHVAVAVLIFALLGKACALCGTYVGQIFTSELFPTVIRNVAMGAGSVSARIATVVAPQIVFLGTFYLVVPPIICIALCLIITPLCFLLPETTGKPLLDTYD